MQSKFGDPSRMGNLPRSMPMTGPLTFLSSSSAYLANVELNGLRKRFAEREADEVARGSCRSKILVDVIAEAQGQLLTALANLEDNMMAVATRPRDGREVYY
jgi:hypothetical protein